MEELETSVNNQEVAETETQASQEAQPETEQAQTEETAVPQQTPEENAAFARMRREQEQARREAAESRRQNQLLINAISRFGYHGNPDEIADQLMAASTGKPIDQVRNERIQQQSANDAALQAKAEAKYYKDQFLNAQVKSAMERDLKAIRKIDKTVKSLDDLGPEFLSLIGSGVDAETAYYASTAKKQAHEKPKPKDMGAIGSGNKEKDYYTPDEVDKLTDAQLDDPKIRSVIRKSMLNWK